MSRRLPKLVKENLEKCQEAATAAVEAYNRPGKRFRTAQYIVMINIAWTALFHAIFYGSRINPWYKKQNGRYERIDGEPKHWDLSECLKRFYKNKNLAPRKNLEFLIGLRNKIEHRHLPALDASLYGECQAALMNLEEQINSTFGDSYELTDQLAVSLQFSRVIPEEKKNAARVLASNNAKSVKDYIETFRGNLPSTVLSSMKYSFNVFLVPRLSNRVSTADHSVEFVNVNEASTNELKRMESLNVLIREKHIPISNLGLLKPSQVVKKINEECPYHVTIHAHTKAWKYYKVRPSYRSPEPKKCKSDFCVYDDAHGDYLYTPTWVQKCISSFANADKFKEITGHDPNPRT